MGGWIRIVFSLFGLIMIGLFVNGVMTGTWSAVNWAMLGVAVTCCLIIFVRFAFVFDFGYASCAMLNGALICIARPSAASLLIGGAAFLYGMRLFAFSWSRVRSASYANRMQNTGQAEVDMPMAAKAALYVMLVWLLTYHMMAVWFVAQAAMLSPGVVAGGVIMLAGTALEGIADRQKQHAKALDPGAFVVAGIYSRWRHPNYSGEIGVQVGLVIAGLSVTTGIVQAVMAVLTPLYITLLMISEARRLDDRQAERYGSDPAWQAYRARSGSLLPR